MYEIRVDLETCDGIFACLVRDGRFAEAEDGLVTLPGSDRHDGELTAVFDDDRREAAEQAAAACPVDAISVADAGGTPAGASGGPEAPDIDRREP